MIKNFLYLIVLLLCISACSNDIQEINSLIENKEIKQERAYNVELIYSDSAVVKVKVISPVLLRHLDRINPRDEFTDGIHVNFYNDQKRVGSYLDAKYALRIEKEKKIIVKDSVVFYNKQNDKLETSELVWDEKNSKVSSEKFVMITRPSKGDTIMGYGLDANEDFTRFEIKRKLSSKMKFDRLTKALESDSSEEPKPQEKPYLRDSN